MSLYPDTAVRRAMKICKIILRAMCGEITWIKAAQIIGVSDRTMRRWRLRYQKYVVTMVCLIATGSGLRPKKLHMSKWSGFYDYTGRYIWDLMSGIFFRLPVKSMGLSCRTVL